MVARPSGIYNRRCQDKSGGGDPTERNIFFFLQVNEKYSLEYLKWHLNEQGCSQVFSK